MNIKKETQQKLDELAQMLKSPNIRIYEPCTAEIIEWVEHKIDAFAISTAFRKGEENEGETDIVGIRTSAEKKYQNPPPGYWANPEKRILFAIININSPINNHVVELCFLYKNMKPSLRKYDKEACQVMRIEEYMQNICVPIEFQGVHKKAKMTEINNWIVKKLKKEQDAAIEIRKMNILKRLENLILREERHMAKIKSEDRITEIENRIEDINAMIKKVKGERRVRRPSKKGKKRNPTFYIRPDNIIEARAIAFAALDAANQKGDDATIIDVTKICSGMPIDQEITIPQIDWKRKVTRVRETVYRLMQTGFVIQRIHNHNPDPDVPEIYMPCDNILFVWPYLHSHVLQCNALQNRAKSYQARKFIKTGKKRPEWDVPFLTDKDILEMKEMEAQKKMPLFTEEDIRDMKKMKTRKTKGINIAMLQSHS